MCAIFTDAAEHTVSRRFDVNILAKLRKVSTAFAAEVEWPRLEVLRLLSAGPQGPLVRSPRAKSANAEATTKWRLDVPIFGAPSACRENE